MAATRANSWQRDELILALDLYFRKDGKVNETDPDTIRMAEQLNMLNRLRDGSRAAVRNANSVDMKVWNFHRFDPAYMGNGRKALQHGNKLDEVIWNEFSSDRLNLSKAAAAINAQLAVVDDSQGFLLSEVEEYYSEASEGKLLSRIHIYRERSPKLVRQKKDLFLKEHGHLQCEVCSFDYSKMYGVRGDGFMECHHIKPLNTYKAKEITKLADLALVCSNCHRMIHAKTPWLTLDELKRVISM